MTMRLRGTEGEYRQATGTTAGNRRSRPGPGHLDRWGSRDLTWAGAQLGQQIQQAGAALVSPPSRPHADAWA
jgi:hypothetical protein